MICPHCSCEFELTEDYAGKIVQCQHCSDYVKIRSLQICPVCSSKSFEKRKLCVECGYDFENAMKLKTETDADELPELPLLQRILVSVGDICPGLFRLSTLIAFILCLIASIAALCVSLMLFALGAYVTILLVAGAGIYVYMQGLAFIFTGSLCGLKTAMGDMQGPVYTAFIYMSFAPFFLIICLFALYRLFQ